MRYPQLVNWHARPPTGGRHLAHRFGFTNAQRDSDWHQSRIGSCARAVRYDMILCLESVCRELKPRTVNFAPPFQKECPSEVRQRQYERDQADITAAGECSRGRSVQHSPSPCPRRLPER